MRNLYSPWAELALLPHIELLWTDLRGRLGEYRHAVSQIHLHPAMRRHQARCVLAHELAHARRQDALTDCSRVNDLQERAADRDAARLLIDVRDLGDALVYTDRRRDEAAQELRVTRHTIDVRMGALHPAEMHYLRQRLADLS